MSLLGLTTVSKHSRMVESLEAKIQDDQTKIAELNDRLRMASELETRFTHRIAHLTQHLEDLEAEMKPLMSDATKWRNRMAQDRARRARIKASKQA